MKFTKFILTSIYQVTIHISEYLLILLSPQIIKIMSYFSFVVIEIVNKLTF